MKNLPMIYCDMDGVLVDFFGGIKKITGIDYSVFITEKVIVDTGHNMINKMPDFWQNLDALEDYHILWNFIKKYDPSILTAKPCWFDGNVEKGKWIWTTKYTPVKENNFFCVDRKDKSKFAINKEGKPNLLIDDLDTNIKEFEDAGGIAIHHKNAETTISLLKEIGYN